LYSKSIRNDKVFPGGQAIIDKYIYNNMGQLEWLYHNDRAKFAVFKQKVCDSIFLELRQKSNMDSLFMAIVNSNHLNRDLKYKSIIESLSITFSGNNYIPLYQKGGNYRYLKSSFQTPEGIAIAGSLNSLSPQSLVTFLNVTSPADHSYQISFALFANGPHRYLSILNLMKSTFLLSLFSILSIILIYFITFRNWIKQKKFAEREADFANSIRHEFHTPLTAIMIANKSLQNEKILERKENILPLTGIIQRQSERLLSLFIRVFDPKSMDESMLEKKEYGLYDLMDKLLVDYRMKIMTDNIEIEFQKHSENRKVLLDKFWFTTMLLNIFDNAIKYNNNKVKKIKIQVLTENDNIEIHISDNGIGISPKISGHIFEKFYRQKNLKDENGLGLGLYYAKQCVNIHKWQMGVKSEEGKGSEFIIYMPALDFQTKINNVNEKQATLS
jgi:two-component system phosphate regulon sensor histidine kinase PhoR